MWVSSHCVSLQPTCLVDQGEPRSVLLSEPHHFFTRISVTLKLCRRLLSGQYGSEVVEVVWGGWGGGVLVFHGSSSRSRGWWFIITSHQSLLFLHKLLQLTFTEKGNLSRVFTVTRLSALRCVNLHAWNVNVPLQECRSCCVWDPQRGSGDLLPAARGIVQELGHP